MLGYVVSRSLCIAVCFYEFENVTPILICTWSWSGSFSLFMVCCSWLASFWSVFWSLQLQSHKDKLDDASFIRLLDALILTPIRCFLFDTRCVKLSMKCTSEGREQGKCARPFIGSKRTYYTGPGIGNLLEGSWPIFVYSFVRSTVFNRLAFFENCSRFPRKFVFSRKLHKQSKN